jgi:hypothetical protein
MLLIPILFRFRETCFIKPLETYPSGTEYRLSIKTRPPGFGDPAESSPENTF